MMQELLVVFLLFAVQTYGQNCTFDDVTEPLCGYKMRYGNDNFNWTLQRGSTPTENTGPNADHSGDGQYIYASAMVGEGTQSQRNKGDKARIISPNITTTENGKLLRFYYYMYGKGVGLSVLNVYILYEGVTKLPRSVWRRTGNRGQKWKLGEVVLPKYKSFRIVFESVVGKSKYSDIAIDDITFEDLAWDCNFEGGTCKFHQYQEDDFDWTRNSGKTNTKGTGPPIDHTRETSRGFYMYIEANDQVGNDRAILVSRPFVKNPDNYCGLSFFYHMMGVHMGSLNLHILYANKTGFDQPVWFDDNNYSNNWMEKVFYLNNITGLFQVAFEGVRGNDGPKGDIGIDDVKLLGDGCSVYNNDLVPGNCTVNPCNHDGVCIEVVGGLVCNCTERHSGNLCETVDLCAFSPCHNGGTCRQVGSTGFACICPDGWIGPDCADRNITTTTVATTTQATTTLFADLQSPGSQMAQITPDISGANKSPTTGPIPPSPRITEPAVEEITYTEEYFGVTDITPTVTYFDYCSSGIFCVHGDCLNEGNSYRCECYAGWRGEDCDMDVNECSEALSDACLNNSTCVNIPGSFHCECADGWMGDQCEKECADDNYSCDYWAGTMECSINPSYMLKYCQYSCGVCQPYVCEDRHEKCPLWASIGECRKNPFYMLSRCHRSCGVCLDDECSTHPCQNGGTCTDLENDYSCTCEPGWGGVNCHIPLDECSSSPCQHDGTCLDSVAYYQCVCVEGYEGDNCETETDHCSEDPCLNGGTCIDIGLDYNCTCVDGFYGKSCENDTNECLSNPCLHGGTCLDQAGSFLCMCPAEWSGEFCEHDFNECQSNPCQNGGSCFHGIGRRYYLCRCPPGYEGVNCETEINECLSNPCRIGATCEDQLGGYRCNCQSGYTGNKCQISVNECLSEPCQNDAKCLDLVDSYACLCPPLYEGVNCESRVNLCKKSPCFNNGVCDNLSNTITTLCHCPPQWEGIYCEISKYVPTTVASTTTEMTTAAILETEEPETSGTEPTQEPTKSKFIQTTTTPEPSTEKPTTTERPTEKEATPKVLTRKPTTKLVTPDQTSTLIPLTPEQTKPMNKQSITTSLPPERIQTTVGNNSVSELPKVDTNKSQKSKETSLFLIISVAVGSFTLAVIVMVVIGVKICRRNTGGRYEQFPLDSTAGGFTWASESSGGSLSYQKFMDSEPTLNDASEFRENSSF